MLKRAGFFFIFVWSAFLSPAQKSYIDLEDYYPTDYSEPIYIKVLVHVFQYKENDPQNFTKADTGVIIQHFKNINDFYDSFDKPTLKPDHEVPFIFDSKIRFKLEGIVFHVDSVSWLRWSMGLNEKSGFPFRILETDFEKNIIGFTGVGPAPFKKNIDSIVLINTLKNNGSYKVDSAWSKNKITYLRLRGKKLLIDDSLGKITYKVERNRNCDSDIWDGYLKGDKNYIHILATGAFDKNKGFGCGPSPYYLNMTNWGPEYKWGGSQLLAHEIGHCIGLSHTDYPQFDDLPKKDKFGWIECDSVEVSNNIMGYNVCRRYLSPKQIAFVHKLYRSDPARIRTTTQCEYDQKETNIFRFSKTIDVHTVYRGDIVVKKNKTLTITRNSFLTDQGTIYLEKGAKLVLDGATLGSACQTSWKGVVKCKKFKNGKPTGNGNGEIILYNGGKIADVSEN